MCHFRLSLPPAWSFASLVLPPTPHVISEGLYNEFAGLLQTDCLPQPSKYRLKLMPLHPPTRSSHTVHPCPRSVPVSSGWAMQLQSCSLWMALSTLLFIPCTCWASEPPSHPDLCLKIIALSLRPLETSSVSQTNPFLKQLPPNLQGPWSVPPCVPSVFFEAHKLPSSAHVTHRMSQWCSEWNKYSMCNNYLQ